MQEHPTNFINVFKDIKEYHKPRTNYKQVLDIEWLQRQQNKSCLLQSIQEDQYQKTQPLSYCPSWDIMNSLRKLGILIYMDPLPSRKLKFEDVTFVFLLYRTSVSL